MKSRMPFFACERLSELPDAPTFWTLMSEDPRPRLLPGGSTLDVVREFGRPVATGAVFEFGTITSDGLPYTLSNPPGEHEPRIFRALRERHPLPPAVQSIDLTPMISVGLNGTGQIDLGRHYHGVTAMLLLQGRKIWALRPPADPACTHDVEGECSAILDVCAHYARPGAPVPACVQEAGETIVVPDGWYHGTCNNASWTVGWGGQNRRMALTPHSARCFHCRPASLPRFMTTAERFVGVAHARAISAELESSRRRKLPLMYAGGAGLAVSLASRALFMQFLDLRMEQALRISNFLDPECLATYAFGGGVGGVHGDAGDGGVHGSAHGGASAAANEDDEATEERRDERRWLFSSEHVYAYVHLSGPASATLRFREISTGESDVRRLALHAAAMWAGDALDEVQSGRARLSRYGDRVGECDADSARGCALRASSSDGGEDSDGDAGPGMAIVCRLMTTLT